MDNINNSTFTECGNSAPVLTHLSTNKPFISVCEVNCFISGVFISNGQISYFLCSTVIRKFQYLTNCSWTEYSMTIGADSLPDNSVITQFSTLVKFGK